MKIRSVAPVLCQTYTDGRTEGFFSKRSATLNDASPNFALRNRISLPIDKILWEVTEDVYYTYTINADTYCSSSFSSISFSHQEKMS